MKKEDQSAAQESELLSCPFCNGPAEYDSQHYSGQRMDHLGNILSIHESTGHAVYCTDMNCIGNPSFSQIHETKEEAFAAWNTRAPQPPITKDAPAPAQDGVQAVAELVEHAASGIHDKYFEVKHLIPPWRYGKHGTKLYASPPLQPTPTAQPVIGYVRNTALEEAALIAAPYHESPDGRGCVSALCRSCKERRSIMDEIRALKLAPSKTVGYVIAAPELAAGEKPAQPNGDKS